MKLFNFSLLLVVALGVLVIVGCDNVLEVSDSEQSVLSPSLLESQGVNKTPIDGMLQITGIEPAESILETPGGICHAFGLPVHVVYSGDIVGEAVFLEQIHIKCSEVANIASGPIKGVVTWNDRTGTIRGQFTTNCEPDPTQPLGISCDGVMNVRGSGELEGVHFKYDWGPGFPSFPYSGTAFSRK